MEIPDNIKKIADSKELYKTVEKVALIFGLNIDQTGELDAQIRSVLLGITSPKDFTNKIAGLLEVDATIAKNITDEVNKQIFDDIRSQMIQSSTEDSGAISSLEKLGGFSIEKNEGDVSNENSKTGNTVASDVNASDRESILAGIENPTQSTKVTVPKPTNIPNLPTEDSAHVDPLIDHLLSGSVSIPEQKTEKVVVEEKKKVIEVQKPRGVDPYREPVK